MDTDTSLSAALNVNGSIKSLNASGISVNTTYAVALTYDGSTVRLFINGAVADSVSASGGLVNKFYENWQIGAGPIDQWPWSTYDNIALKGLIDSIRVSNVARYTDTYIPSVNKLSFDSHTLFLQNWDNIFDMFAVATTPYGACYTIYRRPEGGAGDVSAGLSDITISDMTISGTLFLTNCIQTTIQNTYVINALYGVYMDNNCYLSRMDNLRVLGASYSFGCLILGPSCGVMELNSIQLTSGLCQFVAISSSGVVINPWFEMNSINQASVLLADSGTWSFVGGSSSNETGTAAGLFCNWSVSGLNALSLLNTVIEFDRVPVLTVYGSDSIKLDNCELLFSGSVQPSSIIDLESAPTRPVLVNNCAVIGFTAPLTNDSINTSIYPDEVLG